MLVRDPRFVLIAFWFPREHVLLTSRLGRFWHRGRRLWQIRLTRRGAIWKCRTRNNSWATWTTSSAPNRWRTSPRSEITPGLGKQLLVFWLIWTVKGAHEDLAVRRHVFCHECHGRQIVTLRGPQPVTAFPLTLAFKCKSRSYNSLVMIRCSMLVATIRFCFQPFSSCRAKVLSWCKSIAFS